MTDKILFISLLTIVFILNAIRILFAPELNKSNKTTLIVIQTVIYFAFIALF